METKFDWCIRFLRIHLQTIQQDIFDGSKRGTLGFLILMVFNTVMISGCCYTMWYYDAETAFNAAITLGGVSQVRMITIDNNSFTS